MIALFGRRGRHRRRWRLRRQSEPWLEHRGWTLPELVKIREDVVAAVGRRHGTEGWPT